MRFWLAALLALAATLLAAPLAARDASLRADCHAGASFSEPLSAVVADVSRWRCGPGEPSLGADRALLSFVSVSPDNARFFGTRPSLFDRLSVLVVRDRQIIAQRRYLAQDLSVGPDGNRLLVPLPPHARGDSIVVVLDRPTTRGLFGDARLFARDTTTDHRAMMNLLLAAGVCGMLFMPLAFNIAYYRVLREGFVLWHLAVSLTLLVQCLLTSGILGHLFVISLPVHARLVILSFGVGVAAVAAFGAAFIEPGKLHPWLRSGLYIAAGQVLVTTVLHAGFPNVLRPIHTQIYYASFIPVVALFVLVLIDAWRRGSRAVRYQFVGWSPFLAVGASALPPCSTPRANRTRRWACSISRW